MATGALAMFFSLGMMRVLDWLQRCVFLTAKGISTTVAGVDGCAFFNAWVSAGHPVQSASQRRGKVG